MGERSLRKVRLDAGRPGRLAQRQRQHSTERQPLALTPEVLAAHLTGDRTCWLAADFDGQAPAASSA